MTRLLALAAAVTLAYYVFYIVAYTIEYLNGVLSWEYVVYQPHQTWGTVKER